MEKIGIIGSGTWGTAIAVLLRNNGHEVTLWSAIPAEIEEMAKTRTHKNLPGVTLPEGIIYTADLEEAMKDKNLLVMAVPSVFVRSTAQPLVTLAFIEVGSFILRFVGTCAVFYPFFLCRSPSGSQPR